MLDAVLAFILALRWPVTDDGCPIIPLPMPHDVFVTDEPSGYPCADDVPEWRAKFDEDRRMPSKTVLEWPRPRDELVQLTLPNMTPVEPVVNVYRTFIITDAAGKRLGTTEGLISVSRRTWVALHGAVTDAELKDLEDHHQLLQDCFTVCAEPL